MTDVDPFRQSLIDPALTRDVARLGTQLGPGQHIPHWTESVTIWGYPETLSTERAEAIRLDNEIWERIRASRLVLHYDEQGRGRILVYEPVAIADLDPELWGDQA